MEHIKKSAPAFQSPGDCRGCAMVLWAPWRRDGPACWHQALTETQQELGASFSQVCRRRSAVCPEVCAGASVLCEKMPGRRKGHFQDSHVLKGKMDGMKPGGGNPFKSMRNSARKQQKEQFSRNYREEKKIWQEIQPGRWSTSFWAN